MHDKPMLDLFRNLHPLHFFNFCHLAWGQGGEKLKHHLFSEAKDIDVSVQRKTENLWLMGPTMLARCAN